MTNKIESRNHPMHFDVNRVSTTSGYEEAVSRFDEILSTKLAVEQRTAPVNILPKEMGVLNSRSAISAVDKEKLREDIINDVTKTYKGSKTLIDKYFENTPMAGLGAGFERAERENGVNAVFLAALAALESDSGRSAIATDKKNLFGFKAYDSNPYSFAMKFDDFSSGIDYVSKYLKDEYLSDGGQYYNGKSIEDINKRYATDKNWHSKIANIVAEILEGE